MKRVVGKDVAISLVDDHQETIRIGDELIKYLVESPVFGPSDYTDLPGVKDDVHSSWRQFSRYGQRSARGNRQISTEVSDERRRRVEKYKKKQEIKIEGLQRKREEQAFRRALKRRQQNQILNGDYVPDSDQRQDVKKGFPIDAPNVIISSPVRKRWVKSSHSLKAPKVKRELLSSLSSVLTGADSEISAKEEEENENGCSNGDLQSPDITSKKHEKQEEDNPQLEKASKRCIKTKLVKMSSCKKDSINDESNLWSVKPDRVSAERSGAKTPTSQRTRKKERINYSELEELEEDDSDSYSYVQVRNTKSGRKVTPVSRKLEEAIVSASLSKSRKKETVPNKRDQECDESVSAKTIFNVSNAKHTMDSLRNDQADSQDRKTVDSHNRMEENTLEQVISSESEKFSTAAYPIASESTKTMLPIPNPSSAPVQLEQQSLVTNSFLHPLSSSSLTPYEAPGQCQGEHFLGVDIRQNVISSSTFPDFLTSQETHETNLPASSLPLQVTSDAYKGYNNSLVFNPFTKLFQSSEKPVLDPVKGSKSNHTGTTLPPKSALCPAPYLISTPTLNVNFSDLNQRAFQTPPHYSDQSLREGKGLNSTPRENTISVATKAGPESKVVVSLNPREKSDHNDTVGMDPSKREKTPVNKMSSHDHIAISGKSPHQNTCNIAASHSHAVRLPIMQVQGMNSTPRHSMNVAEPRNVSEVESASKSYSSNSIPFYSNNSNRELSGNSVLERQVGPSHGFPCEVAVKGNCFLPLNHSASSSSIYPSNPIIPQWDSNLKSLAALAMQSNSQPHQLRPPPIQNHNHNVRNLVAVVEPMSNFPVSPQQSQTIVTPGLTVQAYMQKQEPKPQNTGPVYAHQGFKQQSSTSGHTTPAYAHQGSKPQGRTSGHTISAHEHQGSKPQGNTCQTIPAHAHQGSKPQGNTSGHTTPSYAHQGSKPQGTTSGHTTPAHAHQGSKPQGSTSGHTTPSYAHQGSKPQGTTSGHTTPAHAHQGSKPQGSTSGHTTLAHAHQGSKPQGTTSGHTIPAHAHQGSKPQGSTSGHTTPSYAYQGSKPQGNTSGHTTPAHAHQGSKPQGTTSGHTTPAYAHPGSKPQGTTSGHTTPAHAHQGSKLRSSAPRCPMPGHVHQEPKTQSGVPGGAMQTYVHGAPKPQSSTVYNNGSNKSLPSSMSNTPPTLLVQREKVVQNYHQEVPRVIVSSHSEFAMSVSRQIPFTNPHLWATHPSPITTHPADPTLLADLYSQGHSQPSPSVLQRSQIPPEKIQHRQQSPYATAPERSQTQTKAGKSYGITKPQQLNEEQLGDSSHGRPAVEANFAQFNLKPVTRSSSTVTASLPCQTTEFPSRAAPCSSLPHYAVPAQKDNEAAQSIVRGAGKEVFSPPAESFPHPSLSGTTSERFTHGLSDRLPSESLSPQYKHPHKKDFPGEKISLSNLKKERNNENAVTEHERDPVMHCANPGSKSLVTEGNIDSSSSPVAQTKSSVSTTRQLPTHTISSSVAVVSSSSSLTAVTSTSTAKSISAHRPFQDKSQNCPIPGIKGEYQEFPTGLNRPNSQLDCIRIKIEKANSPIAESSSSQIRNIGSNTLTSKPNMSGALPRCDDAEMIGCIRPESSMGVSSTKDFSLKGASSIITTTTSSSNSSSLSLSSTSSLPLTSSSSSLSSCVSLSQKVIISGSSPRIMATKAVPVSLAETVPMPLKNLVIEYDNATCQPDAGESTSGGIKSQEIVSQKSSNLKPNNQGKQSWPSAIDNVVSRKGSCRDTVKAKSDSCRDTVKAKSDSCRDSLSDHLSSNSSPNDDFWNKAVCVKKERWDESNSSTLNMSLSSSSSLSVVSAVSATTSAESSSSHVVVTSSSTSTSISTSSSSTSSSSSSPSVLLPPPLHSASSSVLSSAQTASPSLSSSLPCTNTRSETFNPCKKDLNLTFGQSSSLVQLIAVKKELSSSYLDYGEEEEEEDEEDAEEDWREEDYPTYPDSCQLPVSGTVVPESSLFFNKPQQEHCHDATNHVPGIEARRTGTPLNTPDTVSCSKSRAFNNIAGTDGREHASKSLCERSDSNRNVGCEGSGVENELFTTERSECGKPSCDEKKIILPAHAIGSPDVNVANSEFRAEGVENPRLLVSSAVADGNDRIVCVKDKQTRSKCSESSSMDEEVVHEEETIKCGKPQDHVEKLEKHNLALPFSNNPESCGNEEEALTKEKASVPSIKEIPSCSVKDNKKMLSGKDSFSPLDPKLAMSVTHADPAENTGKNLCPSTISPIAVNSGNKACIEIIDDTDSNTLKNGGEGEEIGSANAGSDDVLEILSSDSDAEEGSCTPSVQGLGSTGTGTRDELLSADCLQHMFSHGHGEDGVSSCSSHSPLSSPSGSGVISRCLQTVGFWQKEQVSDWLKKNKLQMICLNLSNLDGPGLQRMVFEYYRNPEAFYNRVKKSLGLTMFQTLVIGRSLKALIHSLAAE